LQKWPFGKRIGTFRSYSQLLMVMLRSNTTRDNKIAKWLCLLGNEIGSSIDINAHDEFAFRFCHSKIVDWLHSL